MKTIEPFIRLITEGKSVDQLKTAAQTEPSFSTIYPNSIHQADGAILFLVKDAIFKKLLIVGDNTSLYKEFIGEIRTSTSGLQFKEAKLSVANSRLIRKYFPFTNPVSLASKKATFGLGDRLGLASPGHIRILRQSKANPILAQQSIRELNLTGRNYAEVLADAVWAVFQEDFQAGYGADGDHLKTPVEVKMALDEGYTMITLDCSEHINNVAADDLTAIDDLYQKFPTGKLREVESAFSGKEFTLKSGLKLSFTEQKLKLNVAIYQGAVDFAIDIFNTLIKTAANPVDFEISIDETMTPTDPAAHYFVAAQLVAAGVKINSMAPRFCGEFQKGIDYIGDLAQFEFEYKQHEQIANNFGYKLSIHSGSDKFSVFPIIGRESGGHIHVKTAGTNWLEAIRVIIAADPTLYREIHEFALDNLATAKQYYHITADMNRIPKLNTLSDEQLPKLMDQNDARQLIHITYGLILQAKNADNSFLFRDRIYNCLHDNDDLYCNMLEKHIGKHLQLLGLL